MANLYRAGFETRRDALRVSAHRGVYHPPSPGLAWRNTTFDNSSDVGGREYSEYTPWGFNGAYYYVRLGSGWGG